MSTQIAQSAVIDPRARIGTNVRIGHFCVVGPDVTIGDNTRVEHNVVLAGVTSIGEDNHIFSNCVIGSEPQDTSYTGSKTCVEIGHGNTIRENCTINRGTEKEDGITLVGDNNYLMTGTHVAHDCKLGDRIVIANNAMLGGHVHIGNDVTLAGGVGVNHFASIGQMSFVSAMSRVLHDVPPYVIVDGQPAKPRAINSVGLKRHDFPTEDIRLLTDAYKLLYLRRAGTAVAKETLFASGPIRPVLVHLFDFLERANSGTHGRGRHLKKKVA